jgi:hypothetical protein
MRSLQLATWFNIAQFFYSFQLNVNTAFMEIRYFDMMLFARTNYV